MEEWFLISIGALFIWTIVNVIDKHILSDELKDPILSSTIYCFTIFVCFSILSLFIGNFMSISATAKILGFLAGMAYSIAIFAYYKAVRSEEISKVTLFFPLSTVIVLLIATLFLGESLQPVQYLGIFIFIAGAMIAEFNNGKHKISKAVAFALITITFFALRDSIMKYVTMDTGIFSAVFWFGVGTLAFSIILFVNHHPHIRSKIKIKGIEHLFLNSILGAGAATLYFTAISLGSVSMISAIIHTQSITVFILATILSRFHPSFVKENISRKALTKKSIAILLVVVGVIIFATT